MLNHIVAMGRLTSDPELRHTQSGTSVASFTLAVDRDRKNESGERETDFIPVVVWGKTAEFVSKYFNKGKMAVLEGRLQIRGWTDKEGNKRNTAEIVATSVYFGDSKKEENTDIGFGPIPKNQFADLSDDDGEFPW
jgi:single-strand DNA-binding protein